MSSLGNDVDFEHTFERQMDWLARRGDIAIAISCSGNSPNVVYGAKRAAAMGLLVITLSACKRDNALGKIGHMNFWVDTSDFGLAQVAHLALLHAICDIGASQR
jgi:D-sedoheptulose 7-phosphate isomerase